MASGAAVCCENLDLVERLAQIADLLTAQGANRFRVGAYRKAAETVRAAPRAMADVFQDEGVKGLEALSGIGRSIAALIREYVRTGRISLLDRLDGTASAEALLATVPVIGPALARRIHDELGIESLEALEVSCHDGSLRGLGGFGPRRVEAVTHSVAAILGRPLGAEEQIRLRRPPVAAVLEVDAEYRRRAAAGELTRIAPRRLNPEGRAWLPVLHTERDGWHFTALFSNTARAHQLGKTADWVVIFADRDEVHDQSTVVSDTRTPGRRVVRGRERETHGRGMRQRLPPGKRRDAGGLEQSE